MHISQNSSNGTNLVTSSTSHQAFAGLASQSPTRPETDPQNYPPSSLANKKIYSQSPVDQSNNSKLLQLPELPPTSNTASNDLSSSYSTPVGLSSEHPNLAVNTFPNGRIG